MVKTKEQIRHEIEETRLRMGDTIDALAYKTDVRSRAGEKVHEVKENTRDALHRTFERVEEGAEQGTGKATSYGRTHPWVLAGVAAGVVLGLMGLFWSRR